MTSRRENRIARFVGFALGGLVLVGLVTVFALRSKDDSAARRASSALQDEHGETADPLIVEGTLTTSNAASPVASGLPETTIEGRTIPPELEGKTRNWSPESSEFRLPDPGEEALVRAHKLDTYDPTNPGPAPNPFVPPKRHLTEEDTRAGLDPAPPQD